RLRYAAYASAIARDSTERQRTELARRAGREPDTEASHLRDASVTVPGTVTELQQASAVQEVSRACGQFVTLPSRCLAPAMAREDVSVSDTDERPTTTYSSSSAGTSARRS